MVHDRERIKAEKKLYIYASIAFIAVIFSLMLLAFILYRKFTKANTEATIVTAINIMKESTDIPIGQPENKESLRHGDDDKAETQRKDDNVVQEEIQQADTIKASGSQALIKSEDSEKLSEIKKRIMEGIRTPDEKDINSLVNPAILTSHLYGNLKEKIESKNAITNSEESAIYNGLEELIESVSAGFAYRLRILTEDRITTAERRMSLLMKCGFSPLQISILFGREKNTISTHRRNLAFKITGLKKADRALDLIIISL